MDSRETKDRGIIREILDRISDYEKHDYTENRDKLIALWKRHHPEAAKESSVAFHPLVLLSRKTNDPKLKIKHPDENWINDVYQVSLRRWEKDPVFGSTGGMIQLGISTLDGTARHDWREFQAIKNQLAGEDCEGFELYPSEKRLLDPSNYYSLWCFPGVKRIGVGGDSRDVRRADEALAPQRDFT